MNAGLRARFERCRQAWRDAGGGRAALAHFAIYAAVRCWAALMNCFPIEANLRTARMMGRIWWRTRAQNRERALEHIRLALGDRYDETKLRELARRSFEHFTQVYLVEAMMMPKILNEWSWNQVVAFEQIDAGLRLLLRRGGVILITAHFGNYELLGYTLAKLGFPLTVIMRPLDNPLLNAFVVRTRAASGLELVDKAGAAARSQEVLRAGGTLCFISDQDAGRKGVFSDFFGRKASWYKSIALLAMQHRVPLAVGCAARAGAGFQYRIELERVIQPGEWDAVENPVQWITDQYSAALERIIRRRPEQYLWIHRRWKSRPRDELAEGATLPPPAAARG